MYHSDFVHLHVHSHYSLLDGAAPVKKIIDAARKFRMPAIAITDHGNMFGAIEEYQYALSKGVKPIIGFEAYLTPGSRHDKYKTGLPLHHLVLLARNITGYRNLVKLSTLGYTEGFYYKPRIDFELLEKYSDGLIALSACLAGEIPAHLLNEDKERAVESIKRYQIIFGKENFYVEIQNHSMPEQIRILDGLAEVAKSCDAPLVATNDSHYINPEDWEAQDALLCLSTNAKIPDQDRFRFPTREFYFKSPLEMKQLFEKYPEAISNTILIAERCNVKLELGDSILPHFNIPDGKSSESYLTELCQDGLKQRYPEITQEMLSRLEYELKVIKRMGFCDYFLIVWDFIKEARNMGIPVGPGRGSAAGSLVAYLLRITDIDPLKYGLIFERFLNPDRISMPDIDIDFSDEGRGEVIDYVVKKYGRNKVSQIVTFNYILAKMAIRDIGRVMGVSLSEVDRIAKMVPEKPGIHLKSVLNTVPELKEIVEKGTDEQKKLLKIAGTIDGIVRHTGVHACGIVISHQDLMDIVPLYLDKSKEIVTQYEKGAIESIGLLKMDFLGLKTLTILKRALDNVKQTHDIDVDLDVISFDDEQTYKLLQKALTLGVFQLESTGMRKLIAKLKPSVFEDIIALLAMYRPGPLGSGMVDTFVRCKHGQEEIIYPHPELEPVLKETYGVFLYQEQCMKTANILANFSMAQADALRKAMGKKNPEAMEKMGKLFINGAVERGIDKDKAQEIFDLMASFAEYGFNKSHSAAYAVITFRTAYLKARYPVEFMAAVLSSEISDTDKIAKYVAECRTMELKILPPDINTSDVLFKVKDNNIRFGLSAIKGLGTGPVESIIEERNKNGPFKSFGDLTRRIDTNMVNSRAVDALVKSGALDCFELKRSQLLDMASKTIKAAQNAQKAKKAGQTTFFDIMGDNAEDLGDLDVKPPDIAEMTEKELLAAEKEVFGFYLTGDPFNHVAPLGRIFSTHALDEVKNIPEGNICRIAGILSKFSRFITKKGDYMGFLTIEADNTTLDVTLFPKAYEQYQSKLQVELPVFIVAQTQLLNDEQKINIEKIYTLEDFKTQIPGKINFTISAKDSNKDKYREALSLLQKNPGLNSYFIKIITKKGEKAIIKPPDNFKINFSPELIRSWLKIFGEGSVIFDAFDNEIKNGWNRNGRYRSKTMTA